MKKRDESHAHLPLSRIRSLSRSYCGPISPLRKKCLTPKSSSARLTPAANTSPGKPYWAARERRASGAFQRKTGGRV